MAFVVPSSTIIVRSQDDLPTPVGDVITLPGNRNVQIEGVVELDPNVRIVQPPSSVLTGRDPESDGIIGEVAEPLISGTNGLVATNLFFRNTSVHANAFCLATTTAGAADPRVSRIQNVSMGGLRGFLLDNVQTVLADVVLDRSELEGIVFRGTAQGVTISNHTLLNFDAPTPTAVVFEATATVTATRFDACNYLLLVPGATGVRKDALATLSLVGFFGCTFFDVAGGTPLDGISADGQADVLFLGNFGVANSKTGGNIGINGNPGGIATDIAVAGTYVPVGNGNAGNHPVYTLDPASARATLVQPAGAPSGVISLGAVEPANVSVFASMSARTVSGNPKAFAARVVKNPGGGQVVLAPEFTSVTGGLVLNSAGSLAFQVSTTMVPGDVLQVQVTNRTDTDNLIIDSVNLGFVVATT